MHVPVRGQILDAGQDDPGVVPDLLNVQLVGSVLHVGDDVEERSGFRDLITVQGEKEAAVTLGIDDGRLVHLEQEKQDRNVKVRALSD